MPNATTPACSMCGARLAHDHVDTICSPCRRAQIERDARREAYVARGSSVSKAAFDSFGLEGVAEHLGIAPAEALDVLIAARIVPYVSERRRAKLRELVTMGDLSHVAVARRLNVSRWTVAAYRQQLGLSDRGRVSLRSPIFGGQTRSHEPPHSS